MLVATKTMLTKIGPACSAQQETHADQLGVLPWPNRARKGGQVGQTVARQPKRPPQKVHFTVEEEKREKEEQETRKGLGGRSGEKVAVLPGQFDD